MQTQKLKCQKSNQKASEKQMLFVVNESKCSYAPLTIAFLAS